jgi:alpha-N-acetylglucosaminidase
MWTLTALKTSELEILIIYIFSLQLVAEFGTDHIYSCDTFNEMTPHTANVTYLSQISNAILTAITDVDPDAVW